MDTENRGYSLSVSHRESGKAEQKVYLKPMSLYLPDIANQAVSELVTKLNLPLDNDGEYALTVTNNNNGVSVDKDFTRLSELTDPLIAADAVKDLINIVRGYESDEETNVCGW
ncbi:MAG: hypothetical protein K0S62_1608 [Kosakonia cowanii]|jgi:hypothetical protein|uniref:DUF1869 domain-containing protein n=1 Tax=Kosakonia cowanii TaxID=208223 RepID=UPI000FECDE24|nr:DUF1869 domain-containing protein [Kosakonia cowanii]MDF2623837.1 hypothetical protein [Kosakonia cowanii]MDM9615365.1 DUF1869 domain-containing protein [Kosakonia cowanii]MDP4560782.1 DUF1869 domain-containing protein [Kosakonia cowanii]QAR44846.1 DUF1869 domain-containing protein [Kosakonia cowanii]